MLRVQPLSFFEKLRSSVGVHCPHVSWSTVWAYPGLFNVLLLWKTTCPKMWKSDFSLYSGHVEEFLKEFDNVCTLRMWMPITSDL